MKIVLIIIIIITITAILINKWKQRKFVKMFKEGNVVVSGLRGRGKDLAFCYVINKRKENYISNVQYSKENKKYKRFEFDTKVWELAGNTYKDMVDGTTKKYVYPYPDGIDYYISDAGIYFPAQYHSELDKKYKSAPIFQALSRQLGDCNVHTNTQKQNRLWDKMREQSDIYVVMRGAKFIPKTKIFFLKYTTYTVAEEAEKQTKKPHFGIGKRAREAKQNYMSNHGEIKNGFFVGRLQYNFDSRRFKRILENGCKDYENED